MPVLVDPDRLVRIARDAIAAQDWIATGPDLHPRVRVAEDLVVFQCPLTVVVHKDAVLPAIVDAVTAQDWIGTGLDLHPSHCVAEDLVVFQCPLAVVVHENAALLTIMDAVAAQTRVSTAMDRNASKALTGEVASLHIEPALRDVDTVPIPTAGLPKREIGDTAHARPEQNGILSRGFNHDLAHLTVTNNLHRLVDEDSLPVQLWPD